MFLSSARPLTKSVIAEYDIRVAFALENSIPFRMDEDIRQHIPAASGVFLLRLGADSEPYVSKAADMRRRIARLLGAEPGISKRLNLRERCTSIEFTATGSEFANALVLYRTLRALFPKTYTKRLRLAPAPLVRIEWENAYPRAYVTTRLTRFAPASPAEAGQRGNMPPEDFSDENERRDVDPDYHEYLNRTQVSDSDIAPKMKEGSSRASTYFGPFRSRTLAETYLNDVLDLFKSRRCNFELHPDPAFPGCVYSEMKMCMAPCFKGCTDVDYLAEVERVEEFIDLKSGERGTAYIAKLAADREAASAALEFETAAALHAKIEKVQALARSCDPLVRRIDKLDAVVLQTCAGNEEHAFRVSIFRVLAGEILGPVPVPVPAGLVKEQRDVPSDGAQESAQMEQSGVTGHIVPHETGPTHSENKTTTKKTINAMNNAMINATAIREVGTEGAVTNRSDRELKALRHELQASIARALVRMGPSAKLGATTRAEQLAIFNRWYYRSKRVGELVLYDGFTPPLRRIARAAVKLAAKK